MRGQSNLDPKKKLLQRQTRVQIEPNARKSTMAARVDESRLIRLITKRIVLDPVGSAKQDAQGNTFRLEPNVHIVKHMALNLFGKTRNTMLVLVRANWIPECLYSHMLYCEFQLLQRELVIHYELRICKLLCHAWAPGASWQLGHYDVAEATILVVKPLYSFFSPF